MRNKREEPSALQWAAEERKFDLDLPCLEWAEKRSWRSNLDLLCSRASQWVVWCRRGKRFRDWGFVERKREETGLREVVKVSKRESDEIWKSLLGNVMTGRLRLSFANFERKKDESEGGVVCLSFGHGTSFPCASLKWILVSRKSLKIWKQRGHRTSRWIWAGKILEKGGDKKIRRNMGCRLWGCFLEILKRAQTRGEKTKDGLRVGHTSRGARLPPDLHRCPQHPHCSEFLFQSCFLKNQPYMYDLIHGVLHINPNCGNTWDIARHCISGLLILKDISQPTFFSWQLLNFLLDSSPLIVSGWRHFLS